MTLNDENDSGRADGKQVNCIMADCEDLRSLNKTLQKLDKTMGVFMAKQEARDNLVDERMEHKADKSYVDNKVVVHEKEYHESGTKFAAALSASMPIILKYLLPILATAGLTGYGVNHYNSSNEQYKEKVVIEQHNKEL